MKRIIFTFLIIFFLLLSLSLTVFFISQRTTFFGRAFGPTNNRASSAETIEIDNCYLFASPLQARADGKEKIRVTVFILDSQGRGVSGEAVFLGQDERLEIIGIQPVTDDLGRAIFDISSSTVANFLIEARAGNKTLPQRVRLNFR
ncbi:hypothetical protein COT64_01520 [Candidatus Shapirobacteria bacterium CG09_land_8_20_14_0_10_39_12]|uniref:Big-1 domain-containing protein n=1 Tax=Candidatus Shapirobacteria bacterium CG09_land_8_20_14_0_10_39_12 TaxID=1974885 RepID=A0A2H0WPR8_9BACT|nr:MAG: hypothetical protein COT64_01520 [Candidatus Shapirobacteria bacterium CG09_land_8_20_14_0_10_39_12]